MVNMVLFAATLTTMVVLNKKSKDRNAALAAFIKERKEKCLPMDYLNQ